MSSPSGTPPTPVIMGPAPQGNAMLASMRVYNQQQWKHYNIDSLAINTKALALHCPLDNGRLQLDSQPPRKTPTTGQLLSLPPEILHIILQHLSIYCLSQFRLLSTYARELVSVNPFYVPIYTHAPASLRAILSTGIGPHITLLQLHTALTSPLCSSCSAFGDFFNLLTQARVCHACFATSPTHPYHADAKETHLLPIAVAVAKTAYGLSSSSLRSLPTVNSLPGLYGRERSNLRRKRISLCLSSTARSLGIAQHGSVTKMNGFVQRNKKEFEAKRKKKWETSHWGNGGMIIGSSVPDPKDLDYGWDSPFRHMAVTRFPFVRKGIDGNRDGEVEWGVPCGRCREKAPDWDEGERKWNVRFSREGLVEHLKVCE